MATKKPSSPSDEKEESKSSIPSAPPITDISKPGKTAPSSTSRPIIVGHKSLLKQDPMVAPDGEEDKPSDAKKVEHKRETVIKPIESDEITDTEKKEEVTEKNEETTGKPVESNLETEKSSESSDAGAIDALAGETNIKLEQQKAKEEAEKKKAEIQQIIDSKKYHLPIHDNAYSGSGFFRWFINILLVLMLLAAAAVLAIDAQIVEVDIALPFDLIK